MRCSARRCRRSSPRTTPAISPASTLAAAGAPGVAALSMMSLILIPLGLPVEVAIILLVAIDPIVDPVLTVVNVQANAATTILLAGVDDQGSRVQPDQEVL